MVLAGFLSTQSALTIAPSSDAMRACSCTACTYAVTLWGRTLKKAPAEADVEGVIVNLLPDVRSVPGQNTPNMACVVRESWWCKRCLLLSTFRCVHGRSYVLESEAP